MEELLILGFFAVALGLVVWATVHWGRKNVKRLKDSWTQTAEALGGEYVPASGSFWKRKACRVDVVIGDVAVGLDYFVVSTGKTHITYTRTRAATSSSKRLRVYRSSVFSSVGKALGMQDLLIGNDAYDEMFIIKSDDEDWAIRVLDDLLRQEHLALPQLTVQIDKGKVETMHAGFNYDVEHLVRRLRFTAALAFSANQQQ